MRRILIIFVSILLPISIFAYQRFGNSTINNASQNLVDDTYDYYQIIPYYGNILKGKSFVLGMDDHLAGDVLNFGVSWEFGFGTSILLLRYDADGSSSSKTYGETDINAKFTNASDLKIDPNKGNNDTYKIGFGFGRMFGGLLIGASYALDIENNYTEYKSENTITDKSNSTALYKKQFFSSDILSDTGSISHIFTFGTKTGMFLPQLQVALTSEKGDNTENNLKTINETYYTVAASNHVSSRNTTETKGIFANTNSSIIGRNLKNTRMYLEGMLKLDMMKSVKMEPELTVGFTTRSLDEDNAKYKEVTLIENYVPGTVQFLNSTNTVNTYSYEKDNDSILDVKLRVRKYFDITEDSELILGPSYSLNLDSSKYKVDYSKKIETKIDNNNDGDYTDAGDINRIERWSGNNDWVDNKTTTHTVSIPVAFTIKASESIKLFVSTKIDYSIISMKNEYENVDNFTDYQRTDNITPANSTNIKQATYTVTDSTESVTTSLSKSFSFGLTWEFAKNYKLNARAYNSINRFDIQYWTLDVTGKF